MPPLLSNPLTLKNGTVIKNRIFKSAMSEALGTLDNHMTPQLVNLYDRWAKGGTGLLISGNVMIDRRALGEPNNLVIEDESDMELLKQWAQAGTQNTTEFWLQLNHPGKQTMRSLTKDRSEEHTSELQSRPHLVCRLLLEKKKKKKQ